MCQRIANMIAEKTQHQQTDLEKLHNINHISITLKKKKESNISNKPVTYLSI